ncbi:MAG: FHA domain-containing protein, partial [Deltaproteobacteria bacterium]|nr:FHA domain-containing protein [Deltaproteobacteria bacterium]
MPEDVKKFRLRLLFQEIDLGQGNFVIGRASACNLTVEDPLVSREHTRILVYPDRAEIHDMGSRNGTQLNGKPVKGGERLRHGDRLRIGSYEFTFVVDLPHMEQIHSQTISSFRCPECQAPYPDGAEACPECTAPIVREKRSELNRTGDQTVPVDLEDSFVRQKSQMLDEVLNMAISMGHWDKAAGFLDTRITAFDKSVAKGRLDHEMLVAISVASLTVARGLKESHRIDWVIETWTRHRLGMPTTLTATLDAAAYGCLDLEPGMTRYL